jgi:DNA polymerase-3 subunit beta
MSAEEVLLCDYSEMPMSIGFPGSSLMEVLNNVDGEDVMIKLSDPSRAGVIYPVEQSENESVLMLLMPMMLND